MTNLLGRVVRGTARRASKTVTDGYESVPIQGRVCVVDVSNQYAELRLWVELDSEIVQINKPYAILPEELSEPLR